MEGESYDVFPNWEGLISSIIRNAIGTRVYSSLPKTPTYPLIIITRIGGVPLEEHQLDQASIQVRVWGENKKQALELAQAARVALHEGEAVTYTVGDDWPVGGFIASVKDTTGISWAPDNDTERDGYVFGVSVIGRD